MIGIVWNPTKVDETQLRSAAADAFGEEEVRWWETSADDPGRAMAEEALAEGCDTVVAVGGDGTVRIVAEVLARADNLEAARLGIVPQGTGNLLARNLDIPLGDISAALTRIAEGRTRDIDMGWVRTDDADDETGFLVMIGFVSTRTCSRRPMTTSRTRPVGSPTPRRWAERSPPRRSWM